MSKLDDQEAYCQHPIYKTEGLADKPISLLIEELRSRISNCRGNLFDIIHERGWEDRLEHVEGLLTCGLVALNVSRKEIYEFEIKCDDEKFGPSMEFHSSGIGLDNGLGCFVCGKNILDPENDYYYHNIAALVSVEDVPAILRLFDWSRVSYLHGDPNCPQIKIFSCDNHRPNLKALHDMTAYYGRFREEMVKTCKNM